MDTEQIKQLATDVNNVMLVSFQAGKEYIEHPLLARIERLQAENKQLRRAGKLTGITLTRKEDGHWLSFESSKGNHALLGIESLESKFGHIAWKAIMEWAEEQVLKGEQDE